MISDNSNKSRVGDIVELKAQAWLLSEGYEVFANISSKGPADLVAIKDNKVLKVDVKKVVDASRNIKKVSHPRKTELQKQWDVVFLYYDEDKDIFAWDLSYIRKNRGLTEEPKPHKPIPVWVEGKEFKSTAAMARYYGINTATFRESIRRGNSPEDTINNIREKQKKVFVNGREFPDKKTLCAYYNIPVRRLEYWTYEKGLPLEDAINHIREKYSGGD